jgi:UPF0716 protein FxsA
VIYAEPVPLLILFAVFIVLPILELYVIIQVGGAIGVVPTLFILLLDGILGAALARSQGRAAWLRFNEATASGRIPAQEVFDGAAIVVGGAFLLAPGFITDAIGLSLLLPPTRALYRRALMRGARMIGPRGRPSSSTTAGPAPAHREGGRARARLPHPFRRGPCAATTTSRAALARSPTHSPRSTAAAMPDSATLGLVSFVGGEGYGVLTSGPDRAEALLWTPEGSLAASAEEPAEKGRASLRSDSGPVEISWSPAGPMLEFGIGSDGVRAYAVAATASGSEHGTAGPGVAWELPASGFSALRTIWAATEEGDLTLLIALRPAGAGSHEEEVIGAARLVAGADPYAYAEPLISTEYDPAGAHVRATLELWAGADEHVPQRGGGLRVGGGAIEGAVGRLEAARFAWRLDGSQAVGAYEILTGA